MAAARRGSPLAPTAAPQRFAWELPAAKISRRHGGAGRRTRRTGAERGGRGAALDAVAAARVSAWAARPATTAGQAREKRGSRRLSAVSGGPPCQMAHESRGPWRDTFMPPRRGAPSHLRLGPPGCDTSGVFPRRDGPLPVAESRAVTTRARARGPPRGRRRRERDPRGTARRRGLARAVVGAAGEGEAFRRDA